MKLYYSPGACSLGIRVLLEEVGTPYETTLVSLKDNEQNQPAYLAVNPKGKVPVLVRDDGSLLTEWVAIATWIARTHPESGILPADPAAEARALEVMDYVVGTMHMQGFARMARPGNFTPNEADQPQVQARGREIFTRGLDLIDKALAGREYAAGPSFSTADAALFFIYNWAHRSKIDLPPNLSAHFARLRERPAVQRALAAEGITL
jgi:glutathione S-transferase